MEDNSLTISLAVLGVIGTIGGTVLGAFLSNSFNKKQLLRQEKKELKRFLISLDVQADAMCLELLKTALEILMDSLVIEYNEKERLFNLNGKNEKKLEIEKYIQECKLHKKIGIDNYSSRFIEFTKLTNEFFLNIHFDNKIISTMEEEILQSNFFEFKFPTMTAEEFKKVNLIEMRKILSDNFKNHIAFKNYNKILDTMKEEISKV